MAVQFLSELSKEVLVCNWKVLILYSVFSSDNNKNTLYRLLWTLLHIIDVQNKYSVEF